MLEEEPSYTVKYFDMSQHVVTTHSMVVKQDEEMENDEDEDEEENTPPNCQHLMLDVEYVDTHFLSEEDRLTESMLELADRCNLSVFYINCHERDEPSSGLICAAALKTVILRLPHSLSNADYCRFATLCC